MKTCPNLFFDDLVFGEKMSSFDYFQNELDQSFINLIVHSQIGFWKDYFNYMNGHFVGLQMIDSPNKVALIFKDTMNVASMIEKVSNTIVRVTIFKSIPPVSHWFEQKMIKRIPNPQLF